MDENPKDSGNDGSVRKRVGPKVNSSQEKRVMKWIGRCIRESIGEDAYGALRDGVALIKLYNALCPDMHLEYVKPTTLEDQKQNIELFLDYAQDFEVSAEDLFEVEHLLEGTNIPQVLYGIEAFARHIEICGFVVPPFQ
ncbi:uncharacterized protein TRIADDRAFT_59599 [Trichoplax adhaerens]|uniref:Calponin-homology (CH) domain-containing protein n=1 Tax=Trichoplax adhaerens TaxID=10228 RepID=B3S5F7_TRIAD|nr:hypothetical protein TRIADDRAFT_59599 [Trichoplax adhaerens]EDV21905.1 hypothetical protein TRIADDRAFT_59599 [Trichoplax adhaerens]|eukprot:XP_002115542.1 hypothetical protein TRIADDRAFT_59599 [Trichoplax adhaerens]